MKHIPLIITSLIALSAYPMEKEPLLTPEKNSAWDGKQYDEHSFPQYKVALHYLKLITLSQCRKLRDLGCGTGAVTKTIAERAPGCTVEGIDISPSMIEVARARAQGMKNLTFMEGDICVLPKTTNSCDVQTCFSVLHWICDEDKKKALKAVLHDMYPGGIFLAVCGVKGGRSTLSATMQEVYAQEPWATLFKGKDMKQQHYPLDEASAETLLKEAGFRSITIKRDSWKSEFDTPSAMRQWLLGWIGGLPAIAALEAGYKEALADAIVTQHIQKIDLKGTTIHYVWPHLMIYAQK